MEPGHEDREYVQFITASAGSAKGASMEPGHEDREYALDGTNLADRVDRLNGARS